MATHFFDLDGTLVNYHTSKWLPGALAMLMELAKAGNQIVIITMRGPQDAGTLWSVENTERLILELRDIGVPCSVIYSVSSPRYFYDDSAGQFIKRQTNEAW